MEDCRKEGQRLWHDRCNWAQFTTSISDDSEMNMLTNRNAVFCLISVARKVTNTHHQSTEVRRNRISEGPREVCFTDNKHTMETSQPDVSDKTSHRLPEYAEVPTNKSRTAQSARILALHRAPGFSISRSR